MKFLIRLIKALHVKTLQTLFLSALLSYTPAALSETILVLGDSLSAAYGIPRDKGWVSLLAKQLGDDYKVVNASISGETSAGGLSRLPPLLNQHQPNYVIVELGGNDGLRGLSTRTLQDNLRSIVEQSQAAQAKVLLLGMHVPPNYGQRYANAFHNSFISLATSMDIPIVPFFLEGIAGKPEYIQADRIHPTAEAQPFMLNNVLPSLRLLLGEQQDSVQPERP